MADEDTAVLALPLLRHSAAAAVAVCDDNDGMYPRRSPKLIRCGCDGGCGDGGFGGDGGCCDATAAAPALADADADADAARCFITSARFDPMC
jgi:hypothetical protein